LHPAVQMIFEYTFDEQSFERRFNFISFMWAFRASCAMGNFSAVLVRSRSARTTSFSSCSGGNEPGGATVVPKRQGAKVGIPGPWHQNTMIAAEAVTADEEFPGQGAMRLNQRARPEPQRKMDASRRRRNHAAGRENIQVADARDRRTRLLPGVHILVAAEMLRLAP
jgi:hypothetical protein